MFSEKLDRSERKLQYVFTGQIGLDSFYPLVK